MDAASVNFAWHDHHFITGVPGLDFANTIVWRDRPEKRQDRIRTIDDVAGWARAGRLPPPRGADAGRFLAIRAAVDEHFRSLAQGEAKGEAWSRLLSCYASEELQIAPSQEGLALSMPHLEALLLHSSTALAFSSLLSRVRSCGNCGWLFVDRTRNGNKRWCIAAMCGSRVKARRYYARKRSSSSHAG